MTNRDQAWEVFLARLKAGDLAPQQIPAAAFNAGYHAGWLDGQQRPADAIEADERGERP